jgi:hypothetical protein
MLAVYDLMSVMCLKLEMALKVEKKFAEEASFSKKREDFRLIVVPAKRGARSLHRASSVVACNGWGLKNTRPRQVRQTTAHV